jgi:hypothetical protein
VPDCGPHGPDPPRIEVATALDGSPLHRYAVRSPRRLGGPVRNGSSAL